MTVTAGDQVRTKQYGIVVFRYRASSIAYHPLVNTDRVMTAGGQRA
jgi:hypothetical protein